MKTIKVLLLLGLFTFCAATRNGMVVGGQKADYTETASATSLFGSGSVDIEDFETSGNGFHVGISEETKSVLTKITYFQTSYDEQVFPALYRVCFLSRGGFRRDYRPKRV